MNIIYLQESNPLRLQSIIKLHGFKYSYWYLRSLGATRYAALRAIFLAI